MHVVPPDPRKMASTPDMTWHMSSGCLALAPHAIASWEGEHCIQDFERLGWGQWVVKKKGHLFDLSSPKNAFLCLCMFEVKHIKTASSSFKTPRTTRVHRRLLGNQVVKRFIKIEVDTMKNCNNHFWDNHSSIFGWSIDSLNQSFPQILEELLFQQILSHFFG